MGKRCVTTFVKADGDVVFDVMADTSRFPDFLWGFGGLESGPRILHEGAEFVWILRLFGTDFRVYSHVDQFMRPRRYQLMAHVPGLFKVVLNVSIDQAPGGSHVGVSWRYTPVAWSAAGETLKRLMEGPLTVREAVSHTLDAIKRTIEKDHVIR